MTQGPPPSAPERLAQSRHLAELLRDANREYESNVNESLAFRRLSARLSLEARRGRREPWKQLVFAAAGMALLVGAAAVAKRSWVGAEPPLVVAEPARGAQPLATATTNVPAPTAAPNDLALAPPAPSHGTPPLLPPHHPATALHAEPARARLLTNAEPSTEKLALTPAIAPPPDCLSLARQGDTRGAEQCFRERAAGSGLGAEMALYEVARLHRDVLADPAGALAALEEYRRRFPSGSLRREADVSTLELLIQLGRNRDALAQSDQLLAAPAGRERAAELRVLRGNIYRRALANIPAALQEYILAERLGGPSAAEATYLRASCLEQTGEREAAAAAYRSYLEQPSHPRAEEARRRLEALTR